MTLPINQIIQGDTLEVLKSLPDECVDMVITSPPYYGLRNYGVEGQIGLENTFTEYLDKMMLIFVEVKRVLKSTGSFYLNMGDCYGTGSGAGSRENTKQATNQGSNYYEDTGKPKIVGFEKSLLMQPERMALRMIDEQGWILRNKIKWCKQVYLMKQNKTVGSVMPSSVKDRFNESGEELYFFVKNKKYYSDLNAVRLKIQTCDDYIRDRDNSKLNNTPGRTKMNGLKTNNFNYRVRDAVKKEGQPQFKASEEEIKNYKQIHPDYGKKKLIGIEDKKLGNRWMSGTPNFTKQGFTPYEKAIGKSWHRHENDSEQGAGQKSVRCCFPLGKNLPSIWQIGSEPHNFQRELGVDCDHFATFPQALVEIPIKFSCPPNGIVCDIFSGSGTTALVAQKLGRNYIGIELNPKYIAIAEKRLAQKCLL